jgi:hypothetical protein
MFPRYNAIDHGQDTPPQEVMTEDELGLLRAKHRQVSAEYQGLRKELIDALAKDAGRMQAEIREMGQLLDRLRAGATDVPARY